MFHVKHMQFVPSFSKSDAEVSFRCRAFIFYRKVCAAKRLRKGSWIYYNIGKVNVIKSPF